MEILSFGYTYFYTSKFFPIRVDPFSEGFRNSFDRVVSFEGVSIPLLLKCFEMCFRKEKLAYVNANSKGSDQSVYPHRASQSLKCSYPLFENHLL